jgi:hypothetical protein
MKNERLFLWLMALLIALHCFVALETFPEFHVLSPSKMQELVSSLNGDSMGAVQRELIMARWSGVNAQYLDKATLVIDVVMLIIAGSLIVKCYRRRKDVA